MSGIAFRSSYLPGSADGPSLFNMSGNIRFTLLFVAGFLLGCSITEIWHHSQDTRLLFAEKLKCHSLAADYVEKKSSEFGNYYLANVDYSPARSSCIAALIEDTDKTGFESYEVIDIVTNTPLFGTPCSNKQECESKEPEMRKSQEEAFQKAIRSAE